MRGTRRRGAAVVVALAFGIGGCSPAPTASPVLPATPAAQATAGSSASAITLATPSSSPLPASASPGPSGGWTWTAVDGSVFGTHAPTLSAALPDGRTIAIANPAPEEETRPALWTSADGLVWQRVPDTRALQPRGKGCWLSVADVKRTAGGLVAVGAESCESTGRVTGRAWTSADGVAWSSASMAGAPGGSIDEIVVTAAGLVGLGRTRVEMPGGEAWQDPSRPAEWTSADGRSWRLLAHPDRTPVGGVVAFGGAYYGTAWFDPTLNAKGDFVADRRSGVYRSPDGLRWHQVFSAPVMALAARAGLLVALGPDLGSASGEPTVWVSPDGAAWARIRLPDPVLPPGAVSPDDDPSLVDVRTGPLVALPGGGLLALGSRDANSGYTAVAWTTRDGRSWSALALPFRAHFEIEAAMPAGSRVILQGFYGEDDGSTGATVIAGTPPTP